MAVMEDVLTKTDLLALVQTAGDLTSSIDLNELLQLILKKAGELTHSPDGAVLLYNKERDSLYFAGAIGENADMLLAQFGEFSLEQVPLLGSKAGTVFQSRQSIVADYVVDDPDHFKGVDEKAKQKTESMICVPLIVAKECLGVMQLLNKSTGAYDQRDKTLLEKFANYAAIALRNARLFEDIIAHMGLYASRKYNGINELLAQLNSEPHTEKLTILFADMRGFRLLCQLVNNPVKVVDFTKQFISMLSEQVLRCGGLVNKFLGDGILAIFREADHPKRAVQCAFAMLTEFDEMRSRWDQESTAQLDFLNIGVGITTDDVIIGTIGSAKVHDFTVIGTGVNLAAAFEKEARYGKRILTDHPTYMAVREMIAEVEGPVNYKLQQADQTQGYMYRQYHLKKLAPVNPLKVFISHNHKNRTFIEQSLLPLLQQNGIKCWYSKEDIKAGQSWPQELMEGLDGCNWFLVIVSQDAVGSTWVKEEVDMAIALPNLRDKIIPLKLDDVSSGDVHSFLRHKQFIEAKNNNNYITELLAVLNDKPGV